MPEHQQLQPGLEPKRVDLKRPWQEKKALAGKKEALTGKKALAGKGITRILSRSLW